MSVKFIHNAEKNVVVAVMQDEGYGALDKIYDILSDMCDTEFDDIDDLTEFRFNAALDEEYQLPKNITGVARCHDEDEFNLIKGKKIALAKARAKKQKYIATRLKMFAIKLRKIADKFDEVARSYDSSANKTFKNYVSKQ